MMEDELKIVVVHRDVYYHEVEYVRNLEKVASAIICFHSGLPWTKETQASWEALTGRKEATTKSLCDFAREVLGIERRNVDA